jgi:hypothetical protein
MKKTVFCFQDPLYLGHWDWERLVNLKSVFSFRHVRLGYEGDLKKMSKFRYNFLKSPLLSAFMFRDS